MKVAPLYNSSQRAHLSAAHTVKTTTNPKPAGINALVGLGAFVVVSAIALGIYFLPNLNLYGGGRVFSHDSPLLWKTPVPLRDFSVAQPKGVPITVAGVTFSAPWELAADRPLRIVSSDWAIAYYQPRLSVSVATSVPQESERYENMRRVLSSTPASLQVWTSRANAKAEFSALFAKKFLLPSHVDEIFETESPQFRGFQMGTTAVTYWGMEIFLCSDAKFVRLTITKPRPDIGTPVTQAEVNLIVQTLRVAGTSASASAAQISVMAPDKMKKAR